MSEYQYVAFRAIDGPVTQENLAFMNAQSSRAQITAWSFQNEYHHGDFRGDAEEMLRRGYDIHLHYANFGIRKLMIRLPHGFPDPTAAKPYLIDDALEFEKDKKGSGGILMIDPGFEPGDLDDLWDVAERIDDLAPLRAEILDGDLRPLYLAYLAAASDMNHDPEEEKDAPVPAGLNKLTKAQKALAELYGIDKALIAAAARSSPPLSSRNESGKSYLEWVEQQSQSKKNDWLVQLMSDPQAAVRREMLAAFQKSQSVPSWPTVKIDRTIAQINSASKGTGRE